MWWLLRGGSPILGNAELVAKRVELLRAAAVCKLGSHDRS